MARGTSSHGNRLDLKPIDSVSTLLSNIEEINDFECSSSDDLRYYRGLSRSDYKLMPSVMRCKRHYKSEGHMLRQLITRRPDEFSELGSTLDRWMYAQHHGLYTRLLDISTNPLVGLFFASRGFSDTSPCDGILYVLSTKKGHIKPYDSDAISIVANFARLRRDEQKWILKKTKKFLTGRGAFVNRRLRIMYKTSGRDIDDVKDYADHIGSLRQENEAAGRYSDMGRLWTLVKQEKPYFVEHLIDPRDLFRIFIVQPRLLFDRVRAQSGAFLVSAHHKTFDFDCDGSHERNVLYRMGNCDVPYDYYRLTVESGKKRSILDELHSLNISKDVLFPGTEESAKTILQSTNRIKKRT